MAVLFFLFFICMILIMTGLRKIALILTVITLFLCVAMLYFHATDILKILL